MEKVCGPFTIPISNKQHLILIIAIMELLRILYSMVVGQLQAWGMLKRVKLGIAEFLTTKYLLILLVKIFLIFDEAHRKKFYLHTCLLEGSIIFSAVIFDCFNK